MKKGDKAKVSPKLTVEQEWIEGEVIDVEKKPFKGIVIAIKDKLGHIFWGKEHYGEPYNNAYFEINMVLRKYKFYNTQGSV